MGSEARNSGFCFAHNSVNFGSGTAKLGEVKYVFMLFHFMYKLWEIMLEVLRKPAVKLDYFVKLGQEMTIGGMKIRLFVKNMEQQGRQAWL